MLLAEAGGNYTQFILLGLVGVVFYFFMIRPQQKKQKETKKMQEDLKAGDAVVTAGGFHGKVVTTEGDLVVIELSRGSNVKIERNSITSVVTK